jgi:hypothetical protein
MAPLAAWSNHAEADCPEEHVQADDHGVQDNEDTPLHFFVQLPGCKVEAESHDEDRKPQGRVIMMDIGDTAHGKEWQVMQGPTNNWVNTGVVNLINVGLLQVGVPALPSNSVEDDNQTEDSETGSATPVDEGITEKEILHDLRLLVNVYHVVDDYELTVVVPSTHAETNVKERPLPEG